MSTYSVLTSDLQRNPDIVFDLELHVASRYGFKFHVLATEEGAVTTFQAVAA